MLEEMAAEETPLIVSFEAFYGQSWSKVYRAVALMTRDRDLANEAVDEAMVRAYENWKSVSKMSNPEGWVYRVAVNWARSRLRRRSLWRKLIPGTGVIHDPEVPDPVIVEAIRKLPAGHREVVVLRFLLDMSEADTAEALGIPKGTVKSRLNRALASLRVELS